MKIRTGGDGKTEYVIRQSWLNTFLMCPEQARLDMVKQLPDDTTDAAAIGTGLHAGVEWVLRGGTMASGRLAIESAYMARHHAGEIRYVQSRSPKTALGKAFHAFDLWAEHVYPSLPHMELIEHRFEVVLYECDEYRIVLRGMIDAVDEFDEAWDWKTANQPYEHWQLKRYYVQPTVYTYALAATTEGGLERSWSFNYAVMPKSGRSRPQILEVKRDRSHWAWLTHQCQRIIELHEAGLQHWPLNDHGWHCSPKWCGAWEFCKGAHVQHV